MTGTTSQTFAIVGGGLAGATAAATLRKEGFDGEVVLIGAESQDPYNRPPLSKGYLRGEEPFEKTSVKPLGFYADNEIETRFDTRVETVDPSDRVLRLSDGEQLHYDRVLLAMGSRNRQLPIPGTDLEGVFDLRTVDDADKIRKAALPGSKAVLVGMGFIGSEVAASLRQLGVEVTAIEGARVPLERALGAEIGAVVRDIHAERGVEMVFEDHVARLEGGTRVERVVTGAGRSIECDFVIIGVGVEPLTDPVDATGVHISNGIVVDEYCRTNIGGIFAAGDVANHYHPVFEQLMRVEHWNNAFNQARVAARNMMGRHLVYDEIHSFWSDQYEYGLEYAGWHREWDEIVVRGSLEARDFIAFYVKDGLVTASVGIDRSDDVQTSAQLIGARKPIDPAALQDDTVDLDSLTPPEGDR
jgi:3-phenylpropionate/trans-cinnamate dioxygenase ferredoxin reductase subunit